MEAWKKYIAVFLLGACLSAAIVGGLVYRSGLSRIAEIGGQLDAANRANQQLAGKLVEGETLVNQLAEDNRRITESNESSKRIIDAAKRELESSRSSVAKIRALLELLRDTQ